MDIIFAFRGWIYWGLIFVAFLVSWGLGVKVLEKKRSFCLSLLVSILSSALILTPVAYLGAYAEPDMIGKGLVPFMVQIMFLIINAINIFIFVYKKWFTNKDSKFKKTFLNKKAGKIIIWTMVLLISIVAIFIYSLFNGTPWGKIQAAEKMETYLETKYQQPFVLKKKYYNYLSEAYHADGYPEEYSDLVFSLQEDVDSPTGYSDTYSKVFWESKHSNEIKAKIKGIFPDLDENTFQVKQIVEKGEIYGPHIPRYEDVPISIISPSLTIHIDGNWVLMDQKREMQKIKVLSQYLKDVHFPVLVEIWYSDEEKNPDTTKVIFIAEDGRIIEK